MRDTEVNFSSSIVTCVATTCQTLEVIKKRRELKMLPFFFLVCEFAVMGVCVL